MEVLKFIYENSEIEFLSSGSENVMVNGTQMAGVFNKDLHQFTKSDHAKAFINSCLKPANAGLLGINTEENLIISRQRKTSFKSHERKHEAAQT